MVVFHMLIPTTNTWQGTLSVKLTHKAGKKKMAKCFGEEVWLRSQLCVPKVDSVGFTLIYFGSTFDAITDLYGRGRFHGNLSTVRL